MCRMASEEPQVSTNLSPFCLGGMTRKPSIRGACCYITCTYDSGTIKSAPDLVDTPRSTVWGFMVIRVHNSRGLFWSCVCNLFLQLSVLMGWHLHVLEGVRMTWVVSIESLFGVKKVPCEKFYDHFKCYSSGGLQWNHILYKLTMYFMFFCIIPGTSQLLSIWCCSHLLPLHEVCPSVYLCTLYHHPHGTRWGMSPIIIFMCIWPFLC